MRNSRNIRIYIQVYSTSGSNFLSHTIGFPFFFPPYQLREPIVRNLTVFFSPSDFKTPVVTNNISIQFYRNLFSSCRFLVTNTINNFQICMLSFTFFFSSLNF